MANLALTTLAVCILLAACSNRDADEQHRKELAIVSGSGPTAATAAESAEKPVANAGTRAGADPPVAGSPDDMTALAKAFVQLELLVATCQPRATPRRCSEAIVASGRPEVAASADLQQLLSSVAECRPDITPAQCTQGLGSILTTMKEMADSERAQRAAVELTDREQASQVAAQQNACDQDRRAVKALQSARAGQSDAGVTAEQLRNAPRLIAEATERIAANCS